MILSDIGHFDEDGLWISEDKKSFASWLSVHKDKKIVLQGKRYSKHRSNNQNSYYWGVVLKIISDSTGHTVDELHEALKFKFNRKFVDLNGHNVPIGGSTTDMGTVDFEGYLESVRIWAATEMGLSIPLPNEVLEG